MYKKMKFNKWIKVIKNFNCMEHYINFCRDNNGYDLFCRAEYNLYLRDDEN